MRKLLFRWLIRYLDNPLYRKVRPDEIANLLDHIANDPAAQNFTDYLDQLADGYKNQFLYTQDVHYKGMIAAYVTLREALIEKRESSIEKKKRHEKNFSKRITVKY